MELKVCVLTYIFSTYFTGITQNQNSMDRYFTIAPAMNYIVNEFNELFMSGKTQRTTHHELVGNKSSRMVKNVKIMVNIFEEAEIATEDTDTPLHNVFTKEIVPKHIATDILNRDALGQKLCTEFIEERLNKGLKSVWDPMSKSKIATFSSTSVSKDPKAAKVKRIKDDCNLFQRFIIASRTRADLDMRDLISKYDFGNVPRSLFASDGNLLFAMDKARLVRYLESLAKSSNVHPPPLTDHSVLIMYGVALLHKIQKGRDIITCNDLSQAFIKMMLRAGSEFDEFRLVMDRYLDKSLKNQTRTKRATTSRKFENDEERPYSFFVLKGIGA